MKKLLIATATVLSLTATPVLAAAPTVPAPTTAASSLSLSPATRAARTTGDSEKLEGRGAIVAAVLAAGVVAGGIIAIANDDDSDSN